MIDQFSEERFIEIQHIVVGVVVWCLQYHGATAIAWEPAYQTLHLTLRKDVGQDDVTLGV